MNEIIGKWVQRKDQPYAGLWFEFLEDGTFIAEYSSMAIFSSGTYTVDGNEINLNQKSHSFGMTGNFPGRFEITNDILKLVLASGPEQPRPANLDQARLYVKQ